MTKTYQFKSEIDAFLFSHALEKMSPIYDSKNSVTFNISDSSDSKDIIEKITGIAIDFGYECDENEIIKRIYVFPDDFMRCQFALKYNSSQCYSKNNISTIRMYVKSIQKVEERAAQFNCLNLRTTV